VSSRGAAGTAKWEKPATNRLVGLACLAALVFACFGGVLCREQQFAFRDVAHFYYPLYSRIQEQWQSGHLPLWEPGENGGTPLLGSPMAAVFYPGKILFALVPYPWGLRIYIVAHVILAFGAMHALARSWGVSPAGANISGLSYAFGGIVLSDYSNIIFLVGAAWAPLGFRSADRWLRLGRRMALVELSLILAMQVLGGDPEAAYITVLCAFGYAIALASSRSAQLGRNWLWGIGLILIGAGWAYVGPSLATAVHRRGGKTALIFLATAWTLGILAYVATRSRAQRSRLEAMFVGLSVSCMLAFAVAAIQISPVLDQIATSVRWAGPGPTLLYDSSLLPYRVFEFVWPNVFGSFSAGNRYWMALLPPAGAQRPWPLSLYLGALPLVLALGAAGFRKGPPWQGWMTAVALLTFWASLGDFAGPARWLGGELAPAAGHDSFYGLLTTILPLLHLFRMPFKLLVFTSLALSTLAGIGWDGIVTGEKRRRVTAITTVLLIPTALLLAVSAGMRRPLADKMTASPAASSIVFGPLDAPGAVSELLWGLGHGMAALLLILIVTRWAVRNPARAGFVALLALAADLAWANASLVITIPQADFDRMPEVAAAIRAAELRDPSPQPFRIHRQAAWVPIGWSAASSPRRLRELVDWEMDTLQPGFGLIHGFSYLLTNESETGRADYERFFQPTLRTATDRRDAMLGVEPGQQILLHPRGAFDLWGARYFIVPSYPAGWTSPNRSYAAFLDQTELIYPDPSSMDGPSHQRDREQWLKTKDVQVRRNKTAFPRAWIVHDARLIQPRDPSDLAAHDVLLSRLIRTDDSSLNPGRVAAVDLKTTAYVETNNPKRLAAYLPRTAPSTAESVTVRYDNSTRVQLETRLQEPGLVILADVFDIGWRLTIDGLPAPILRSNLLMRAAAVSAGTHTLVYTFEPVSVRLGAVISLTSLPVLVGVAIWARLRPVARVLL
jgi:hypothetical protein